MVSHDQTLVQKYVTIFFVVAGYWVISISMVFVSKTLLSDLDLEAPMFIAFFQTVISAIICFLLEKANQIFALNWGFSQSDPFDLKTIKTVLPVSILFTLMIATNNLCLKYVNVAFYYIGRSLTTVFNIIFTYLILREKTSTKCIACCLVIAFGFCLGVDQENLAGSLSISGTIFGVSASAFLSLYSIYTKRVLPALNNEVWLLSYYNNIYASGFFLLLIVLNGEVGQVSRFLSSNLNVWTMMLIGAFCGFAVGFFTSLQIKYTSALTHNISGTAKACAQTVLATYWYRETKSFLWWLSNFIVLFGSGFYAHVKRIEMEVSHASQTSYQKV